MDTANKHSRGDAMLEEDALLLLPTDDDLPDSDEKPVDNELQILAPALLRAILSYIWAGQFDWFFAINLGVYYDTNAPAIGPDAFLSLGVPRIRPDGELRRSYVLKHEKVMPQWVLEVVSREPGGEYVDKFKRYASMGVLYYTIYNPKYYERDGHEVFEVYKLKRGRYVRQRGNPVWMPEIGLGIGHEFGEQEEHGRDWLYWYDEQKNRYPAPEDALKQERDLREQEQILREREQLIRRELEEELGQERLQKEMEVRSRLEAEQALEAEARSREAEQALRLEAEQALEAEAQSRLEAEQALEAEARSRKAEQTLRLEAEQALVQEKQTIALNLLKRGHHTHRHTATASYPSGPSHRLTG
jgi:Uma2 family endonuclease